MKLLQRHVMLDNTLCAVYQGTYPNGRVALVAHDEDDGEPFATLTKNLDHLHVEPETFFLDTNNCPWVQGDLIRAGLVGSSFGSGWSGYCKYPLHRLRVVSEPINELEYE